MLAVVYFILVNKQFIGVCVMLSEQASGIYGDGRGEQAGSAAEVDPSAVIIGSVEDKTFEGPPPTDQLSTEPTEYSTGNGHWSNQYWGTGVHYPD